MKRILFVFFFMLFVLGLSAQRNVRKETHKGDKNYREQRYGAAEEKYKAAIDLVADPKNKDVKEEEKSREAFYNLGNTYYRQGRWDEAIKEYSNYQAMEPDPTKQSGAWSNIGNSYLNKAIRKAPPKDPSQQQAGEEQPQQSERLPRLEDLNKSKDAYKNALRLNPADDESRYNLAVVQKMIKDQEDNNKDNKNQDNQQQKDQQQQKQDQQQKDQQQKKDQQDQQDQKDNQMSQQNIEQILNAIEQDEKETQARVQQQKAEERKKMNARNKRQSKDW